MTMMGVSDILKPVLHWIYFVAYVKGGVT